MSAQAAPEFASPVFRHQWQRDEANLPKFWGPAIGHRMEPYVDAPGGKRLAQYFDKGRMELTDPSTGIVTNGLLAKELVTGNIQLGDATFRSTLPPDVPVAGDPGSIGPTYRWLSQNGKGLFEATPKHIGMRTNITVAEDGTIVVSDLQAGNGPYSIAMHDGPTRHNVMKSFAEFRDNNELETMGYAISEPFMAKFTVAGTMRTVAVQIFERRILTFTAANPEGFKIEFGNIGQHYQNWRH